MCVCRAYTCVCMRVCMHVCNVWLNDRILQRLLSCAPFIIDLATCFLVCIVAHRCSNRGRRAGWNFRTCGCRGRRIHESAILGLLLHGRYCFMVIEGHHGLALTALRGPGKMLGGWTWFSLGELIIFAKCCSLVNLSSTPTRSTV